MTVYVQVDLADPFEAYPLTTTILAALKAHGLTTQPVADGSMGGARHEVLHLGALPPSDTDLRQLASTAVVMGRAAAGKQVICVQDGREVTLTQDEGQTMAIIRAHVRGGNPIHLLIR